MIVNFFVSAAVGFGFTIKPKITWIVIASLMVIDIVFMVFSKGAMANTSAVSTLTTIFGTGQQIIVTVAGFAFGWLVASGYKRTFR